MISSAHGANPGWKRFDAWLSFAVLILLIGLWIVLAATVPKATNRSLTFDISCASGNAVVGVWVESASGGSGWAQESDPSESAVKRYTFQQVFNGSYEVRVGCGGNRDNWGIVANSVQGDRPYRRLVCDDVNSTLPLPAHCRDQVAG